MIPCNYSEAVSASSAVYSPSGTYLATVSGIKVTVRDSARLNVVHTYQCIDKPDKIEFSPDSGYFFCAYTVRGVLQCFSISDPDWKCRINEGVSGFINAFWMADSRGVITVSDFGIQLSVWSLLDSTSHIISSPKYGLGAIAPNSPSQQQLLAFSDCSRFLGIVHRMELHDYIGVYSASPFQELSKFKSKSSDVAALSWTPRSTHIVTVDSPLTYKLIVYTASGEVVANFEAYQHALGIRSIDFFRPSANLSSNNEISASNTSDTNSSSQILSVASYDGKIRLLSMRSWQAAFVLPLVHPREMDLGLVCAESSPQGIASISSSLFLITVEVPADNEGELVGDISVVLGSSVSFLSGSALSALDSTATRRSAVNGNSLGHRTYVTRRANTIKALPKIAVDPRNSKFLPPQQGVSWHARSANGALLAARESSHPRCLWIWSVLEAKLTALIIQIEPILCAQWKPCNSVSTDVSTDCTGVSTVTGERQILAFCTGTSRIYFWCGVAGGGNGVITYSDIALGNAPSSTSGIHDSVNNDSNYSVVSGTGCGTELLESSSYQKQTCATSLQWSHDGKNILFKGKDVYFVCEVPGEEKFSTSTTIADNNDIL